MRSRLAALMLIGVLILMSAINLPAAPRPGPASAVLDIGSPRKGMTADEYCEQVITGLTHPRGGLWDIKNNDEVKKLPSFARLKKEEVDPWLTKNLCIKEEKGGRHLRLAFGAGTRPEQVVILNALLQAYTRGMKKTINSHEKHFLKPFEEYAAQCAENSKKYPTERAIWEKREAGAKKDMVPIQAEVDRLKEIAVIKWAK